MASCTSPISKSLDLSILFKMQSVVHKNDSVVIPCALLLATSSLVLFEHMNQGGSVRNYLAMNLMTMLPFAFLERKILVCTNPVGLISEVSGSVLLLHLCFLALRLPKHIMDGGFGTLFFFNFGSLVAACILLFVYFGVQSNFGTLYQHRVALFVALVALVAAALTEGLNVYLSRDQLAYQFPNQSYILVVLPAMAETGALYIELLAFVPAVWVACLPGKHVSTSQVQQHQIDDTRQKATCLLAFLVGFYLVEDTVSVAKTFGAFPLVATAHVIHFALVLDFAGFLLANLYDPAKLGKLMGSVVHALSDLYSV